MLLQSRQKMEFNMLESQNLLTEVLFDPVRTSSRLVELLDVSYLLTKSIDGVCCKVRCSLSHNSDWCNTSEG